MLRWHAVLTKPGREVAACVEITGRGFASYLPTMQRQLSARAGGGLTTVARFSGWTFAEFDPDEFGWELIGTDCLRAFGIKVRCDGNGRPTPVPERAIDAMRAYKPTPRDERKPDAVYRKGCPVLHYTAGVPQQAVFVRYLKQRAQVELWILGRPRTVTVALGALEEVEA